MTTNRPSRHKSASIAEEEPPPSTRLPEQIQADAMHAMHLLTTAAVDDVRARFALGQVVHQIRYDSSVAFTARTLAKLARVVHLHVTALRRYARVTEVIGPQSLADLINLRSREGWPLTWSHIELLAEVRSEAERQSFAELVASQGLSVRELGMRVRAKRGQPPLRRREIPSLNRQ